jgi:hypothetical protein
LLGPGREPSAGARAEHVRRRRGTVRFHLVRADARLRPAVTDARSAGGPASGLAPPSRTTPASATEPASASALASTTKSALAASG